jgi:hypothetical protein
MAAIEWVHDDGGRAAAGFRGSTDDCVTRAIAIATGRPYREVYDDLHEMLRAQPAKVRGSRSPRDGVTRRVYEPYLFEAGWWWEPTMSIGSGTTVHLRAGELPAGRLLVRVTKHLCAVIDGVVHDTHDPSRDGTRAVYGFYANGQR